MKIPARSAVAALALAACNAMRTRAMREAIDQGDVGAVRRLLDKGFDPSANLEPEPDRFAPQPALCRATERKRPEIAKVLLERGARVDAVTLGCLVRSCDGALVSAAVKKADRAVLESPDGDEGTPLASAAGRCAADVVRPLLAAGAGAAAGKDGENRSPIDAALHSGRADNVEALLAAGAALPAPEEGTTSALDAQLAQAAERGHGALVELLLRRGAALHDPDARKTLLVAVADRGSVQGVAALLPRYGKEARSMAMWRAAFGGHADAVEALLAAGADPDFEPVKGDTALARAVEHGSADVVAVLLRHHARGGDQQLAAAAEGDHREVIEALLPGARPAALAAALTAAVRESKQQNARLLLERGAAIEEEALWRSVMHGWTFLVEPIPKGDPRLQARSVEGHTLAMLAVTSGQGPLVELLGQKGVDLDAPSGDDRVTPLMASVVADDRAPFEVLSTKALRWDAADANGLTALFYAVAKANEPAVKLLLSRGADPNRRARTGRSVLLAALTASSAAEDPSRFKPVVAALLSAGATIDLGNAQAGDYAGELSRLGIDPAAVEAVATQWRAGCAAKDLAACSKLGNMLATLGKNAEAEQPLRQSCEHGDRRDCLALGMVAYEGGRQDEAIRLWTDPCKARVEEACANLGMALGEQGKREEARRVLDPSCGRGFGWACLVLGAEERKAGHTAVARRWLERACFKVPEGCYLLGSLELEAQHAGRARVLFEKACDDGVAEACRAKRRLTEQEEAEE